MREIGETETERQREVVGKRDRQRKTQRELETVDRQSDRQRVGERDRDRDHTRRA